jgi:hypothetical protein
LLVEADLKTPVAEWLGRRRHLSDSARRQVKATLGFLGVLVEPWRDNPDARLIEEVGAWRTDGLLAEALAGRFRERYAAAGCDERHARLIGEANLSEDALERVLADEPPFSRFGNSDTRKSALRFARQIHAMIVAGELVPDEGEPAPPVLPPARRGFSGPRSGPAEVEPARRLNDLGTVVSPKSYRVGRLRDDLWVYGVVHFQSPEGAAAPGWLDRLGPEEQARFMEQLAASLLQEADVLREKTP